MTHEEMMATLPQNESKVAGASLEVAALLRAARDAKRYIECLEEENTALLVKLKAYEDAEEQGLLVRLPCKVGDTVWCIDRFRKKVKQLKIITIEMNCKGWNEFGVSSKEDYTPMFFKNVDIGKTVFLTREAAEAALEERENDNVTLERF